MMLKLFCLLSLLSRTAPAEDVPTQDKPSDLKVTVLYCHDGDTCRVNLEDAFWFNVRLAGIDTPEVKGYKPKQFGQPMGDEARDYLNKEIKGKIVKLRQTDLDGYNRSVVEIYLGGKNINLAMIEQGFAEAYRGHAKRLDREPYYLAEKVAKEKRIGIWSMKAYKSPSLYRQETR